MTPTIWEIGRGALLASIVWFVSSALAALLLWPYVEQLHLRASYTAWVALLLVNQVVALAAVTLSKIVAHSHGASTDQSDIWTSSAVETIALGFGVLAPLSVQATAVGIAHNSELLKSSALGVILIAAAGRWAIAWYFGAVTFIACAAVLLSVLATSGIQSLDTARRQRWTTLAFGLSFLLLVVSTLFLTPWLPGEESTQGLQAERPHFTSAILSLAVAAIPAWLISWFSVAVVRALADRLFAVAGRALVRAAVLVPIVLGVLLGVAIVSAVARALSAAIGAVAFGPVNRAAAQKNLEALSGFGFEAAARLLTFAFVVAVACVIVFYVVRLSMWLVAALPRKPSVKVGALLLPVMLLIAAGGIAASLRASHPSGEAQPPRDDSSPTTVDDATDPQSSAFTSDDFQFVSITCKTEKPAWIVKQSNDIRVGINRCVIEGGETANFIVVIGSANNVGNSNRKEAVRALERGWLLAGTLTNNPRRSVYVLSLGKITGLDTSSDEGVPIIPPLIFQDRISPVVLKRKLSRLVRESDKLSKHSYCGLYKFTGGASAPSLEAREPEFEC